MIGKNVTRTTTRTFGSRPNPNQTTINGAIATIGTVCDPTRSGSTARRAHATRSSATATTVAHAIDRPNPTAVSTIVGIAWRTAWSRKSHRAPTTWLGAGSTNALTPDARAYSSHAARTSATSATGGPCRRVTDPAAGSRS